MNIFIIPSWYPSSSNPIYGIFNKEQARLLARERPEFNVGVSKWGQGESALMLPALQPASYLKILKSHDEHDHELSPNLMEYFSPAFTWTRKFRRGNIEGIFKANQNNLERYAKQYGSPDIICAQASYPAAIVAQRLSKQLNIPYVVIIYMSPFPFKEFLTRNGQLKSIIKDPLTSAHRLLSSCNALKDRMGDLGLKNIDVVPFPVDTVFFEPKNDSKDTKQIKIFAVGRIEEQKGFDLLLEAVAQINQPFELRIGGDGSMITKCKALSEQLGLKKKVVWLGLLDKKQIREEMQNCSFYVLSSRHETFGIVQVEAMACGKPVVATKCGGPEDIISEEVGYLCNNLDVADLTLKINLMIENFETFSAARIREIAVSKYGPKAWVSKVESIFRALV